MEERLQKVLARAGVASRREAEKLIQEGRVTVNGRVIRELGVKVDAAMDEVRVDTVAIARSAAAGDEPRTYLLLNKPKGVVCTVRDPHGRPTVVDLVPPREGKRLYPVGRLDEDSEGLVLLTDDGDLTERLTHPRFGVPKVYDVRVRGLLRADDARRFEEGVWLSEGRTGRSRVRIRRAGREVTHVAITLTEGRNREIRRAFAKLGFHVLSIRRIRIGPVGGRGLPVGAYRPLDREELAELRDAASGKPSATPRRRRGRPRDGDDAGETPRPRRRRPGKPDPARFGGEERGPSRRGEAGRPPRAGGPRKGGKRPGAPRTSGWTPDAPRREGFRPDGPSRRGPPRDRPDRSGPRRGGPPRDRPPRDRPRRDGDRPGGPRGPAGPWGHGPRRLPRPGGDR